MQRSHDLTHRSRPRRRFAWPGYKCARIRPAKRSAAGIFWTRNMIDQTLYIQQGIWARLGLRRELAWGFVGVFLFITGATIEQSWLASCCNNAGWTRWTSACCHRYLACSSRLSVVFRDVGVLGVRRLMWLATCSILSAPSRLSLLRCPTVIIR